MRKYITWKINKKENISYRKNISHGKQIKKKKKYSAENKQKSTRLPCAINQY